MLIQPAIVRRVYTFAMLGHGFRLGSRQTVELAKYLEALEAKIAIDEVQIQGLVARAGSGRAT